MKLQNETIEILKNFAAINPNLVVKENENIKTISEAKTIFASYGTQFENSFGIYDLNMFLNVVGLVGADSELQFADDSVTIKGDKSQAKYRFADPSILTHPQNDIKMPDIDLTVKITQDQLSKLTKAASILGNSVLSIHSKGDGAVLGTVTDPKNSSVNSYLIELDTQNVCKNAFDFHILISNLKILPGEYTVEISRKFISKWTNGSRDLTYLIALEKTSTFNA